MTTVVVPNYNNMYSDPKYKCCCQSCHVTTGAKIIGVLEAVGIGLSLISGIVNFAQNGSSYGGMFAYSMVSCIIGALIVFALFWGLNTGRAGFLLPHLVMQVLNLIGVGIVVILVIVSLAAGGGILAWVVSQSEYSGQEAQINQETLDAAKSALVIAGVIALVILAVFFGIEIWFFLVVLNCYRYLKENQYQQNYVMTMDPKLAGYA